MDAFSMLARAVSLGALRHATAATLPHARRQAAVFAPAALLSPEARLEHARHERDAAEEMLTHWLARHRAPLSASGYPRTVSRRMVLACVAQVRKAQQDHYDAWMDFCAAQRGRA